MEPAGVVVDEPPDATAVNTPVRGASLADLTARMGHDSPDAAMIYQHATRQKLQYSGCVDLQRRLASHAHYTMRGTTGAYSENCSSSQHQGRRLTI